MLTNIFELIVVGDQSSGKSSVLEALTGLPFPRDSALCTRFPTQVIFKRSTLRKTEVSVIPSDSKANHAAEEVERFERQVLSDLNEDQFLEVLSDVCSSSSSELLVLIND